MKRIFFCLLLLNFQCIQAQSLKWYEGSVVLSSNKVLTGKISIEPVHNIILFERDDVRTVYPAHKIQCLYFYDEIENINRRFVSISNSDNVLTAHDLYEVVLQGEVSVLRRQKIGLFHPSDVFDFTYHIRYQDEIVPLRKFNKKIYPLLLVDAGKELDDFISKNKLKAINDANSIRIIQFYNHLVKSYEVIARY